MVEDENDHKPSDSTGSQLKKALPLFVISFEILFLEVLLIRYLPSNVRVLAYFTNTVLIAAFLGLGLGCLLHKYGRNLIELTIPLLLVTLGLNKFFSQVRVSGGAEDQETIFHLDTGS